MKYEPGKKAEANPKRDEALIKDYLLKEKNDWKYSTTQLTMMYGVSASRIYQVLNKNRVAKRNIR